MDKEFNMFYAMEQRGYEHMMFDERKYTFVKDKIICEVYKDNKFEMIYTNDKMLGLLVSGKLDGISDDKIFSEIENRFLLSIKSLEETYNG